MTCRFGLVLVACVVAVGCSQASSPATSASASSSAQPASPSPSSSSFAVDLPVGPGDTAAQAYGLWPFGVHGSSHAADGHPGFDVEFRIGAQVLAAADGTVASVAPDTNTAGRFTIRLMHTAGSATYATDYTNVGPLASGITAGAVVTRGQALGAAGVQTQLIGSAQVTWAMTHFQLNDFSRNEGLTNPNAVSPELFLSAAGRALFATMWQTAAYAAELTEPLATNDRNTAFPLTRAWTLDRGTGPARLEFTRASGAAGDHTYAILGPSGALLEAGIARTTSGSTLSLIDLLPATGPARLGVYAIVSTSMRLALGEPGAPRPAALDAGGTYSTR